jgi:hypothetical protein
MKNSNQYLLASLVALTLISCEKPPENIEDKSADQLSERKSFFETTATEIAKEYAANPAAADNRFKDATYNVTGVIVETTQNLIKEPFVSLKGGVKADKEPQFVFQQSEKDKAATLKTGQEVKLQCIGQGDLSEIPMSGECKILD